MKLLKTLGVISLTMALFYGYCLYDTHQLSTSHYTIESKRLPYAFEGFKILHLSDIHGQVFGENQEKILGKIRTLDPEIIVISGDSLDRQRDKWDTTLLLISEANKIAPVYVSLGNHESIASLKASALKSLKKTGAILLNNKSVLIKKENDTIMLSGLNDPKFFWGKFYFNEAIQELANARNPNTFSMLLSHRPELKDLYAELGFDVTFSGHAHGGQVRLPFIGGLASPHQGFFPKLTAGVHPTKDRFLVISRGLGNQYGFARIFNPPELILVTLKKK